MNNSDNIKPKRFATLFAGVALLSICGCDSDCCRPENLNYDVVLKAKGNSHKWLDVKTVGSAIYCVRSDGKVVRLRHTNANNLKCNIVNIKGMPSIDVATINPRHSTVAMVGGGRSLGYMPLENNGIVDIVQMPLACSNAKLLLSCESDYGIAICGRCYAITDSIKGKVATGELAECDYILLPIVYALMGYDDVYSITSREDAVVARRIVSPDKMVVVGDGYIAASVFCGVLTARLFKIHDGMAHCLGNVMGGDLDAEIVEYIPEEASGDDLIKALLKEDVMMAASGAMQVVAIATKYSISSLTNGVIKRGCSVIVVSSKGDKLSPIINITLDSNVVHGIGVDGLGRNVALVSDKGIVEYNVADGTSKVYACPIKLNSTRKVVVEYDNDSLYVACGKYLCVYRKLGVAEVYRGSVNIQYINWLDKTMYVADDGGSIYRVFRSQGE